MRAVALAVAACLLAGCASPEPPSRTADPSLGGDLGEGRGGIEGVVLDDLYATVAGIQVRLEGPGQETQSDGTGRFWFWDVAPGEHMLTAYSSNQSHAPTATRVAVLAGAWSEVQLVLPRVTDEPQGGWLEIRVERFAFTPREHEASLGDLPLTLKVTNADAVPHKFAYEVVCSCNGTVLARDLVAVAPSAHKVVPLPVMRANRTHLAVGDGTFLPSEVEVRFSDPDFAALGMTGRITFR